MFLCPGVFTTKKQDPTMKRSVQIWAVLFSMSAGTVAVSRLMQPKRAVPLSELFKFCRVRRWGGGGDGWRFPLEKRYCQGQVKWTSLTSFSHFSSRQNCTIIVSPKFPDWLDIAVTLKFWCVTLFQDFVRLSSVSPCLEFCVICSMLQFYFVYINNVLSQMRAIDKGN